MASKSKYIGVGTTILTITSLIIWMVTSSDFTLNISEDINCAGTIEFPCLQNMTILYHPQNPLYKYFYLRNKEEFKLDFSPDIKDYALCKKDGRYKKPRSEDNLCGPGMREILVSPYYYKYEYYYRFIKGKTEEWFIVGLKHNPEDVVKWGFGVSDTYLDPVWDSVKSKFKKVEDCHNESYNVTEPILGNCSYNWTHLTHWNKSCPTPPPVWINSTEWCEQNGTTNYTCRIGYKNVTRHKEVCILINYTYGDVIVEAKDWTCFKKSLMCYSNLDSNRDDIHQSGESWFMINDTEDNHLDSKVYKRKFKKVDKTKSVSMQ